MYEYQLHYLLKHDIIFSTVHSYLLLLLNASAGRVNEWPLHSGKDTKQGRIHRRAGHKYVHACLSNNCLNVFGVERPYFDNYWKADYVPSANSAALILCW